MLDIVVPAQLFHLLILERCAVVGGDLIRDPKPIEDFVPDKLQDFLGSNPLVSFGLSPFGEVIRSGQDVEVPF